MLHYKITYREMLLIYKKGKIYLGKVHNNYALHNKCQFDSRLINFINEGKCSLALTKYL